MRRCLLAVLVMLALPGHAAAAAKPDVVVIETDDQTMADMSAMPRTRALIGAAGVTFGNSFVSLSQCCPSRATFLTGQYAHNDGVRSIARPYGGYLNLRGGETLPVWLRRAGYATGLVGKYLNGYGDRDPTEIPPGWTSFQGLLSRFTYRFYDYFLNADGRVEHHGYDLADYQTDVLTRRSLDFVRANAGRRPYFLWTTYVAPHTGRPHEFDEPGWVDSTVQAPRHRWAFLGTPLPRPPSFNEADMGDKPPGLRGRPVLGPRRIATLAEVHRQRLASLLAVDEGVERIVAALRAAGTLDRTLLVFTSDNGFLEGQHRVPTGKILPYEPSIRVPLMMRGPGIHPGSRRSELVWNGDLAPTILDAAGTRSPFALDGRSLLGPERGGRDILLEGPPARRTGGLPRFAGLRTSRYKYVEYAGGFTELYDLRDDPDETSNLAGAPALAGVQRGLARRLDALRRCAGAGCR